MPTGPFSPSRTVNRVHPSGWSVSRHSITDCHGAFGRRPRPAYAGTGVSKSRIVVVQGTPSTYRARGERYVLGVPCTTTMRDLETPVPAYAGRGRRPKAPWQSVIEWRETLQPDGWTRLTVRDGEKGPVGIEMVTCRVQTRLERKRTGPEEWLVITRRPLTDESTLERRPSRDATDQDARYRYQYYLTPTE